MAPDPLKVALAEEPENTLHRAFQAAMPTIYRGDDLALVVPAILGVQAASFS